MKNAEQNADSILVLGAGKVGSAVADLVAERLSLHVTLADLHLPAAPAADDPLVHRIALDAGDGAALRTALARHRTVVNCLPWFLAEPVATQAAACGVHYLDLTEDVGATRAIRRLAGGARALLMPQCGLAPGVIGMLGHALAQDFERLDTLRLRVGALGRHANNRLRYHFTWSIDGVINEYCNPCDAIVDGRRVQVQPLEGLEQLVLDGQAFEAFHTAGGLGTLCETLEGRVRQLDYKSIRHPGHREAMALLLHDLRLAERRPLLREVLEGGVPHTREDVVVVFAAATGWRDGRLGESSRAARLHGGRLRGRSRTAIELATAAGVVGVLELLRAGRLPQRGFVAQEQVPLADFLATRAGRHYKALAADDAADGAARPAGAAPTAPQPILEDSLA